MTHRFFSPLKAAFTSTVMSLALVCGTQAEPGSHPSAPPYRDASLPPGQRTEDLLGRLTLEEKIKLLGGYQFYTMPIERLGIPSFVMSDGPQGVRTFGKGCAFPCGAALAATWNPALARFNGEQLGLEARARGIHYLLGPGMNICRVAVNGRNFEYFGEDPYLASMMASQYVQGVQSQGVIATVKHFAGNNQEWQRLYVDAKIDERALHEIYFPAFKRSIQEGGAWAIMDAYNRLNGTYCTDSLFLHKDVLREGWGFKGIVMSDWGACHSVTTLNHGMDLEMPSAASLSEPTVKAALADGQVTLEAIDAAVHHILLAEFSMGFFDRPQKKKDLPEDSPESSRAALEIARSAVVLLKNANETLPLDASKIRSIIVYGDYALKTPISGGGSGHVTPFHTVSYLDGIRAAAGDKVSVSFEPAPKADPSVFETLACAQVTADGPAGLSLKATVSPAKEPEEAAQTGGAQPMEAVVPGINLAWGDQNRPFGIPVGRNGALTWEGVLIAPEDGDWELVRDYEGTARWNPKPNIRIGTPPPQFSENMVPQWETGDGLHLTKGQAVPIRVHWYVFPRGRQTIKVGLRRIAPDVERARQADAVIVCTGRMAGESNDSFFDLPLAQQRLVEALAAVNPRTIVVNTSGAGLGLAGVSEAAPALLQAWFLGQEAGTALGEILFGKVNPSGRLPMTFDRDLADNAAFANYPGELPGPSQPPVVEYKEGVFVGYRGYDRSGKAPLYPFGHGLGYTHFAYGDLNVERIDEGARVTLNITNDGPREGAEVVQIYAGQPGSTVERPPRELKGFAKVSLQPGETRKVAIDLPRDAFAYWSPEKKAWTVEPGEFVIEAGASSRDLRLKQTVRIGETEK